MFFQKTLQRLKTAASQRFAPSREHIAGLQEDITNRLSPLRQGRSEEEQEALREDFFRVLVAWGIDEDQLPGVMRDLRLRLACFALPLLMAAVLCTQAAYISRLLLIVCVLACVIVSVVGVFTTLWRLWVLESRTFLPIGVWLLGRTEKHT